MPDSRIECPGCRRPLNVPPSALGRAAHCPHCRVNFFLPANPDGSPSAPQLRERFVVPRIISGPAFALLVISLVGVIVNGTLLALFVRKPEAALEYARGRVFELRALDAARGLRENPNQKPEDVPEPTADDLARDEAMAAALAPTMTPRHAIFLGVSLVAAAGAAAMLLGRWYPLALLGCFAAAVNLENFCCVPGGLAGLWAFLVLIRDEGRVHFGK